METPEVIRQKRGNGLELIDLHWAMSRSVAVMDRSEGILMVPGLQFCNSMEVVNGADSEDCF